MSPETGTVTMAAIPFHIVVDAHELGFARSFPMVPPNKRNKPVCLDYVVFPDPVGGDAEGGETVPLGGQVLFVGGYPGA
jgi:hypothetical protein